MRRPGASRRQLTRTLNAAYADGLISHDTLVNRLDHVLASGIVDPRRLVADLSLRAPNRTLIRRLAELRRTAVQWLAAEEPEDAEAVLLALDWNAAPDSVLFIGRHGSCDIVLSAAEVSRRHARLFVRDGGWIVQDLASTNGTLVNGVRVGRCKLAPGDHLRIATEDLRVD